MEATSKPFDLNDTKVLHLELTTRCNAACPQCARTDPNSGYHTDHELTLARTCNLFSTEFVSQLDKMFACGNYGDPAAAQECLEIFRWFREVNPGITLGMNTNGGLRTKVWWQKLADVLHNPRDYAVFSIDGLADTNHLYRRNVRWSSVITNAECFIAAGGNAQWDMLVFEHNKHQVDDCRKLAKDMGFRRFRTKVSNRFDERPVTGLSAPAEYQAPTEITGDIRCHAVQERSLYVAATGDVLPCCFIGSEIFKLDDTMHAWVQQPGYHDLVASWDNKPHRICKKFCASAGTHTRFTSQWQEDTPLC